MLHRRESVAVLLDLLTDQLVVAANGLISRELYAARDRPEHFYMLGSMGLAPAIGLGLALARPRRQVVVFDGDGNLLMGLGNLAMVAERRPANLLHVVFDNGVYGSTGGQRSIADRISLGRLATAAGYPQVDTVATEEDLRRTARLALDGPGPRLLRVVIAPQDRADAPRIPHAPEKIAARFREVSAAEPGAPAARPGDP